MFHRYKEREVRNMEYDHFLICTEAMRGNQKISTPSPIIKQLFQHRNRYMTKNTYSFSFQISYRQFIL